MPATNEQATDIVSWTFANQQFDQDAPLYIDSSDANNNISARGVRTLVRQLVAGLRNHGLASGDTVCVVSFNDIRYTSLYLGIIGAGGHFTGANPGYKETEIIHHLRMTNSKVIITAVSTLGKVLAAAAICDIPQSSIFVLNLKDEVVPKGCQSWKALLEHGERDWVEVEDPASTTAAYCTTSGTSGLPKAAIISHSYMIEQAKIQEQLTHDKSAQLLILPAFHVFSVPLQHGLPLRKGVPTYIMSRFGQEEFLEAVVRFQIATTIAVPKLLVAFSKAPVEKLQSLRRVYTGGSPAPEYLQSLLYPKLHPDAKIIQVYGMTEFGWATVWAKPERDHTGSVGQQVPGTKLRIVCQDARTEVKDGTEGEVQIYCPTAMKGYMNNAEETAEAFTSDGWVKTGDVGFVKDGNWYITDRIKDLIKVRGFQVSPAEIETVLIEHPDILDAGVISIPSRDGTGESPLAFITKKPGSDLDTAGVRKFLATRLAGYKNVEEVQFIEAVPRNPTGKILRRELRSLRRKMPKTEGQIAAEEYSTALKHIALKRSTSKNSLSGFPSEKPCEAIYVAAPRVGSIGSETFVGVEIGSTGSVKVHDPAISVQEETDIIVTPPPQYTPAKESKKRKYCTTNPFEAWRQLRLKLR